MAKHKLKLGPTRATLTKQKFPRTTGVAKFGCGKYVKCVPYQTVTLPGTK